MPGGAGRQALAGLFLEEMAALLTPLPFYRAKQIFSWIMRGTGTFDGMTDIPQSLREELDKRFVIYSGEVSAELRDPDGTVKLIITLYDESRVEAVLLTDGDGRRTACLSTQAGCPMGCVFCKTGALGFRRNLDSAEILSQFFRLKKIAGNIANVVFMGMGEPLLNINELYRAVNILTDGINFSPRRITVSTCGIVTGIRGLAENSPHFRLALSIPSADEELRNRLMPSTAAANPLSVIKEALSLYQAQAGMRITLEMVLLKGINTRRKDAEALAEFVKGLNAVVNLIPWNPVEGMLFEGRPLQKPNAGEIARISSLLEKMGLKVTRRYRKGHKVEGACGQLGTQSYGATAAWRSVQNTFT